MHDFDVGALSLSVPPSSAVIQSYRPAVLVRNNGIHDALASGSLRIYSPAGLLIFTTEIYSGTIAPGETAPAQAVAYWTPPGLGHYMFIAYVTCINDQFEPNNNLAPVFIDVIPGEPTPPTLVAMHAAQHEEGGSDELNADGLRGKLADSQTAIAHKTSHQVAGADELNLSGLGGILRDGQPIADHHSTHENGGGDELSVEGLGGVLVNLQPPQVHDNAKHDPNYAAIPHNNAAHDPDYATVSEFNNHLDDTTAVHAVATNLEQVAHKGEPEGYPELDEYSHVPPQQLGIWTTPAPSADKALLANGTWDYPTPSAHKSSHQNGGGDELSVAGLSGKLADAQKPEFLSNSTPAASLGPADPELTVAELTAPASYLNDKCGFVLRAYGSVSITSQPGQHLHIYVRQDGTLLCEKDIDLDPSIYAKFKIEALVHGLTNTVSSYVSISGETLTGPFVYFERQLNPTTRGTIQTTFTLSALFSGAQSGTILLTHGGFGVSETNQL